MTGGRWGGPALVPVHTRTWVDMMADQSPPQPRNRPASGLRFSIAWLLGLTTVVALAAALLTSSSFWLRAFAFKYAAFSLTLVVPVCLVTLAVYCRGIRQTFFLGAAVGAFGPLILGIGRFAGGPLELLFGVTFNAALAAGCGAIAVATRRFAERRDWHRSSEREDFESKS